MFRARYACFELAAGHHEVDDVVCPVIQQTRDGDSHELTAAAGPLTDSGFCCGLETITTTTRDGERYLRVGGDMVRVCGGGTASESPDAIYRIAGDRLVLEADDSLLWH
jgi:hypothetical protein